MASSIREIGENIKNAEGFKGLVLYEESLSLHTTMKVGGKASLFVEPHDTDSLTLATNLAERGGTRTYVIGGGSNLIFSDSGFDGMILSLCALDKISVEKGKITCGAGVKTNALSDFAAENGIAGLTNFAGLPGTVGGACYMNARCYDKSFCEVVESIIYLEKNIVQVYHVSEDDWSYKHSPFMEKNAVILSVTLKALPKEAPALLKGQNERYVQNRREKGHFAYPSAGSVFKNNRAFGKPSGAIIDGCGLKSVKRGGAQVAPWHGNIIINTGNATAGDIAALVKLVGDTVFEKTGFALEKEIIFVN